MWRRRANPTDESSHGIELAPMLDFVVNLLIFFIVTAVFVKESAVTVNRPTGFARESSTTENIEILENGDIRIADKVVDVRSVRAHVERISALDANAGVLIVAKDSAPTGTLVAVVDQVHLGGIVDITFTTAE